MCVSHRMLTCVEKLHINGVALLGRGTDGEMISEYRSLPTTWPKLEHKNKIVHVLEDGKPAEKHRRLKLKNTKYYFHKWVIVGSTLFDSCGQINRLMIDLSSGSMRAYLHPKLSSRISTTDTGD